MPESSVTIIIPVYNEAGQLDACLQAIASQSIRPHEVIVVDNNSTDDSVAVASKYDFVTVLHEPRQGVVHARNRGFDAASGTIIGRIDADTVVDSDWVAAVEDVFRGSSVAAVTGMVRYKDMRCAPLINRMDLFWRRRMARLLKPEMPLQGANMAIRRSAWRQVRPKLCAKHGLHEDFDLAIHLALQKKQLAFDESLKASIGLRCCRSHVLDYARYWLACPHTYAYHGLRSRRHMYPVIALLLLAYPFLKMLYKTSAAEVVSGRYLAPRVNPATFVD